MQQPKEAKEHKDKLDDDVNSTVITNISQSTVQDQSPPDTSSHKPPPGENAKISLRHRLKHFTFAWFLSTMSTGGLSIALAETPHQFPGLYTIGLIVLFFDIALFTLFCTLMVARAVLHPQHFRKALTHPHESFFIGSFWLSISVIIGGVQVYGITHGPGYAWLVDAVYVLYWIYAACSLANSIMQYWVLIQASALRPVPFTPSMFLAGYSAMLTGTIASIIAGSQPADRAVLVIISGCAYQGFGWLISFVCIVYFVRLLLDNGPPPPQLRPAMFIPVGSVAYTVVALMGQASAIPNHGYFARHPTAKETLQVVALFVGVFMWLFSFWIFAIAVLGNASVASKMPFALTWWALIFPNVGFMLATSMLGKELDSPAMLWIASVLTILLVAVWLVSVVSCIRAVWLKKIVWPGKDEDKNL